MSYVAPDRRRRAWLTRPDTPRIAVDLLGGDDAPAVVVDGALRSLRADADLSLLLVGPGPAAEEVTAAVPAAVRERVQVLATEHGVGMADRVANAADPQTSIGAAMRALAAGCVDAVVSAGSSGATVTAAVLAVRRMPGVRRPALAAVLPGTAGPVVLLDVGAGIQANPADLAQHAVLGVGYARLAAGIAHPRVGLLSVGAEAGKGDRLRRATDAALRTHRLGGARYVGFVEGDEVITGSRADVVVTDGFTGNVLLKGVEAALRVASAVPAALPRAAALLGVAGTVVVCHGAASGEDIASGLALGAELVRLGVVSRLAEACELPHPPARRPVRLAEVAP